MSYWTLVTGPAGSLPEAPQALAAAVSSGEMAAMVMLLGFLGLIGGILFRWSSDTSFRERSVFSPPNR